MTRAFFYDTWAFVALANQRDRGHEVAVELDRALELAGFSAITTDYVLDETVTLLHSAGGARVALAFLDGVADRIASSELMLVEIGAQRRARAVDVFRKLAPREARLSFTDATSFSVMSELDVELAFTADRHFHTAGQGIAPLVELRGKRLVARSLQTVG
jgi:predicted nucleic acid-binding protein